MKAKIEKKTFTISEAGALAGVSPSLAYKLAKSKEWPTVSMGRRIVVLRQPFLDFIERGIPWKPAEAK